MTIQASPRPLRTESQDLEALIEEARRRRRRRRMLIGAVLGGVLLAAGAASGGYFLIAGGTSTQSGPPGQPALSFARAIGTGTIIYKCQNDLCLMRSNGHGHRPLIAVGPSPEWDPAFSPNGRQVAFRGYYGQGDGEYALYVARGCRAHRLTSGPADSPSWSPDGKWIAFDTIGVGGNQIWKVHPDGSGLTRLLTMRYAASPSWSPDGRRIAFAGKRSIWVVNANGNAPRTLHRDTSGFDGSPVWSHDGSQIAFVHQVGFRSQVEVMRADGTRAHILRKRGRSWNPVWLPGDAGVAFLAGVGPTDYESYGEILAARPDGSHIRRISSMLISEFAWTPARLPGRCG